MRVTRRYRFSASHRLHTPMLALVEADAINVVERAALDDFVRERILRRVEYKNLNVDLPEFSTMVPTTENLARLVRDLLLDNWNLAPRLAHLRISETDRNAFDLEVC